MNQALIINNLARHKQTFESLLSNHEKEVYRWKPTPDKWCLLEIVCHLYDEEREDFRARTKHILHQPAKPFIPIFPVEWVEARDYLGQNYEEKLKAFLSERQASIDWLHALENPSWENVHTHQHFGAMTANLFLANWLEHDYIHLRQIIRTLHQYNAAHSGQDLTYAGG